MARMIEENVRLTNPYLPDDENSKLNVCINNVYNIWERTAEQKSTQVIFCDLGVPQSKTDEAKNKLFAKVRKGEIRVLIGSTQKMGAGTNIQGNLIASHDLDAPWKPSDMERAPVKAA